MARPPRIMFPSTLSYRVAWNNQHTTLFRNDMDSTVSSTVWTRPLTQQTTHTSVRYSQYAILNKSIVMPDPQPLPVIRRDSRDLWDERDGLEASSLRVAHVLLVSLTIHERQEGSAERRPGEQAHHAPRDVGL